MERDSEKLAAIESLNSGKGIRIARYVLSSQTTTDRPAMPMWPIRSHVSDIMLVWQTSSTDRPSTTLEERSLSTRCINRLAFVVKCKNSE
jgi:hypothetical protein